MTLSRHPPAGRAVPRSVLVPRGDVALDSIWPGVHSSLFQSGTAALAVAVRAALAAIPSHSTPAVALPAYGCPNLAAAVLWAGVTPEYYDLARDSFAPTREVFDAQIASANKVLVHVDAFGIDTLTPLCPQDGVGRPERLVHDLAQSFAPYVPGWRPRARYTVLSLGRAKPVSLTLGGVLLADPEQARSVEQIVADANERTVSGMQRALRYFAYSASLRPLLFGLLSRVPQLHIGQTRFTPLETMERLGLPWRHRVAVAAVSAGQRLHSYAEQTADMLRLVDRAGAAVPAEVTNANRLPQWRMPVICATAEGAAHLARVAAHLGVSRLYGKSLPELMGISREQAMMKWPNAVATASRLVTLPTHGRLNARERDELRALLATVS